MGLGEKEAEVKLVVFSMVRGLGEGRGGGIHNGRQCYVLLQI